MTAKQGLTELEEMAPYLPFRFAPRLSGHFAVSRKDLLRHLNEASLLKQLLIVRGPAGSGKSTLLSQWCEISSQMGRPIAWLTLDAADLEPEYFILGLAHALDKAKCPEIADGFRSVACRSANLSSVQTAQQLAVACNRSKERPILLLDQYEKMDCIQSGQIISAFLGHVEHVRMLIASRNRPQIPIGNLLARDQIFEIGPSDLNLTPTEVQEIFGSVVPELFTRRLHLETSGEPLAIGFARRVMDTLPRDTAGTENWHEQLHQFYRSEILDSVTPEFRAAMSRLVVVERFDLSLAQVLIGRNASDVIEQLHHVHGLLLRHKGTEEFYFSEMLRRFLEQQLAWLESTELAGLHRCAAEWLDERHRYSEALRHAISAGDKQMAERLLESVGYANLVTQEGISSTHELLDLIGIWDDAVSKETLLSRVLVHVHEGKVAEASAKLEEVKAFLNPSTPLEYGVENQRVLAEAYIAAFRDETSQAGMAPALERYLQKTPLEEHECRAQAYVLLSWDHYCQGEMVKAEDLLHQAASEYSETEAAYACIFMYVHRTLARYWRNSLSESLEDISLAEKMVRIFFPHDHRLRAMTTMIRAGVMFEMGRPDTLTDITTAVGAVAALETWTEIQIWAHTTGARAALAGRMHGEARGIVSYGMEVARRLGSQRFEWSMQLASINIALHTGEVDRAKNEAIDMGLLTDRSADNGMKLTWQEKISGQLHALRVARATGDASLARKIAERARLSIGQINAPRYAVELELALAGLADDHGDGIRAETHVATALGYCNEVKPITLFVEAGEKIRQYIPDIFSATPSTTEAQSSDAKAQTTGENNFLTAREHEVLSTIGEGHPNKVVADRLGLSEATVKFHLRNIYRKLNARNRTQALANYRSMGGS